MRRVRLRTTTGVDHEQAMHLPSQSIGPEVDEGISQQDSVHYQALCVLRERSEAVVVIRAWNSVRVRVVVVRLTCLLPVTHTPGVYVELAV